MLLETISRICSTRFVAAALRGAIWGPRQALRLQGEGWTLDALDDGQTVAIGLTHRDLAGQALLRYRHERTEEIEAALIEALDLLYPPISATAPIADEAPARTILTLDRQVAA